MSRSTDSRKKNALLAGVVVVLALALLVGWASFHPRALESVKTITVNVTHTDGVVHSQEIRTTARTLWEALEPYGMIEALRTEWGPYLASVDGEAADSALGIYWVCAVNSAERVLDGSTRAIEDGDVYDFYTVAY